MNTQNTKASRIATLLHQTRSASWTSDNSLELAAAMDGATPLELALALLQFSSDLLRAAKQVVALQRDAAIIEMVVAERDQGGATH